MRFIIVFQIFRNFNRFSVFRIKKLKFSFKEEREFSTIDQDIADLEEKMADLDILYMTRVQKERFFNEEDYLRLKDSYILNPEKLENAKPDLSILHPLPRVNEISVEVDDDPRAVYFKQTKYAVYVRMALILTLLEVEVC